MILLKRLLVPVQPAIERSTGLPSTTPSPSRISCHMLWRRCVGGGGGSAVLIKSSEMTDTRNESASSKIAIGAVTSCTSAPAMPGPAIAATERLTSNLLLPSIKSGRETSAGKYDW